MRVAGIDYSSHAVDLVTVPYDDDTGAPEWQRYELWGEDAFDRTRSVGAVVPGRRHTYWDGIVAVGIEHPAGHHGTGPLLRVQGAILARIPARMLVHPLPPAKWRQLVGLKGNASKDDVADFACLHAEQFTSPQRLFTQSAPQDMFDAYCLALATRSLIEQVEAA